MKIMLNVFITIVYLFLQRTCWWNESCKKEFQRVFRCRCPDWAYCQSPGRYYAAHCSFTKTGYIWEQKYSQSGRASITINSRLKNKSHKIKSPRDKVSK